MNARKWLALLMSLVLLLGLLPGMALAADGEEASAEPTAETEAQATAEPSGETTDAAAQAAAAQAKLNAQLDAGSVKYAPETVVATVDGVDVTWRMFYYLLASQTTQLVQYFGGIPDFSSDMGDGTTLQDTMRQSVEARMKYYTIPRVEAENAGLTEAMETEVEAQWQQLLESYESVDALAEAIEKSYMDEATFRSLLMSNAAFNAIMENTYGANGEKLSDEDVLAWANDKGYMRAKHILFLTQNDDGTDMTDEEKAEVRRQAEAALAELRALENDREAMLERFDALMADADDPGMTQFPDGYTFTDGAMVQEFEDGTKALGEYEISDIVETSYGYHVILRLPLDPETSTMSRDSGTGAYMTLRQDAANELFNDLLTGWITDGTVEWKDGFAELDYNEVFAVDESDITPDGTATPEDAAEPEKTGGSNVWMYIAIAAIVVVIALAAVLLGKKKPVAPAEEPKAEEEPKAAEEAEAPAEEASEESSREESAAPAEEDNGEQTEEKSE